MLLEMPHGRPRVSATLQTASTLSTDYKDIQTISMQEINPAQYIFNSHVEAEEAIRSLGKSGFDVKKLSLIGKGYHSEEHPIGFYTMGDKIKSWGGVGAFWGGIWGLLLAPAVFVLPGLGVVAMAGPIVAALVGAIEGAVVVGGVSGLVAALTQLGVPKDQVVKYESALKADKYVLLVHGDSSDIAKASSFLTRTRESESEKAAVNAVQRAAPLSMGLNTRQSEGNMAR